MSFLQPLPTKLVLQKKKAKEGRSGDEIEHFPVPSRITVSRTAHGGTMERGESSGMHVWVQSSLVVCHEISLLAKLKPNKFSFSKYFM
jgi:hypothetical protein